MFALKEEKGNAVFAKDVRKEVGSISFDEEGNPVFTITDEKMNRTCKICGKVLHNASNLKGNSNDIKYFSQNILWDRFCGYMARTPL